jgi:hypothetical protein
MILFALPALYAGFAPPAGRDAADGLLDRWAGVEAALGTPSAAAGAKVAPLQAEGS